MGEVLPAIQKNLNGIQDLVAKLTNDLSSLEKQTDEFRQKFNITVGEAVSSSEWLRTAHSEIVADLTHSYVACCVVCSLNLRILEKQTHQWNLLNACQREHLLETL